MSNQTPPGTARALRVNVKRKTFTDVPAWGTGTAGLSMVVTDEPGWAVVHDNSGVMVAHTKTWEGARNVARLFESVTSRHGRSWVNECDPGSIMSAHLVRVTCASIARDYRGK